LTVLAHEQCVITNLVRPTDTVVPRRRSGGRGHARRTCPSRLRRSILISGTQRGDARRRPLRCLDSVKGTHRARAAVFARESCVAAAEANVRAGRGRERVGGAHLARPRPRARLVRAHSACRARRPVIARVPCVAAACRADVAGGRRLRIRRARGAGRASYRGLEAVREARCARCSCGSSKASLTLTRREGAACRRRNCVCKTCRACQSRHGGLRVRARRA